MGDPNYDGSGKGNYSGKEIKAVPEKGVRIETELKELLLQKYNTNRTNKYS